MTEEVRIPDIGDVDHVEVIEICVAVGDTVGPDDALVVIESDKASMEVPAGKSGKVASIDVAIGDEVREGSLIVTLERAAGAPETAAPETAAPEADAPETAAPETAAAARAVAPAPAVDEPAPHSGGARQSGGTVEVRVPDIGEATNVEVIEVAVAEGDRVGADDLLVVVESDKASMEIPAGQAGTVAAVHVGVGTEVVEGTLLATIRLDGQAGTALRAEPARQPAAPVARDTRDERAVSGAEREEDSAGGKVYAGPAVRRLARELGVDLARVKGSGNRGRILKDDVKAHVKASMTSRATASAGGGIPAMPAVDFSRFGAVEIQPLSRIRAAGASNLHRSWLNLPHVTQFEEADVTEL
ncbi:MAG TPA: biotin/lipoyl-containing protein, partial [Pseudomonadales bacterium]